jgi:hypothetical protein
VLCFYLWGITQTKLSAVLQRADYTVPLPVSFAIVSEKNDPQFRKDFAATQAKLDKLK